MPATNKSLLLVLIALAALTAPVSSTAAESYDNCTGFIDSVPATISTQGTWCLRQDVSTAMVSGVAITMAANNIILDCNGFKLGGLAAGAHTGANGVVASDRLNITVRNCNIRGFSHGIAFGGANGGGHLVEDNRLEGNTVKGALVVGDGSMVRRNQIIQSGGSTSTTPHAYGLFTSGSVDVIDNTISGVVTNTTMSSSDSAFGIYTQENWSGSIMGNRVRGVTKNGSGVSYGINNVSSRGIRVVGNHIVNIPSASGSSVGIHCGGSPDPGEYSTDNIVSGFATPISGCISVGDVIVP